jgi:hypothetical protein
MDLLSKIRINIFVISRMLKAPTLKKLFVEVIIQVVPAY